MNFSRANHGQVIECESQKARIAEKHENLILLAFACYSIRIRPGIGGRSSRAAVLATPGAENAVAGIGAFHQFDSDTQAQQVIPGRLRAIAELHARMVGQWR